MNLLKSTNMRKILSISLVSLALLAQPIKYNTVLAKETTNLLYLGSWDSEVSTVQKILQNKGYFNHEVTGYYGTITKSAVENFQKDCNIRIDGIVGSQTRGKLYGSPYSEDDLYWLSRIVHAEAQGEGYQGMLAVANCVLNRVESKDFPDTVKGVIFDRKHGVQYQPTANGTIYNTPSSVATGAAKAALEGTNNIGKSMYFFNPKKATSNWIVNNRTYYTTIGNHAFYL